MQSVARPLRRHARPNQFFDADGGLLNSVTMPDYRFDPRTRPWYKAVGEGGAAIVTSPYPFSPPRPSARRWRKSADGKAVVGLDVTLGSIAEAIADSASRHRLKSLSSILGSRSSATATLAG